MEWEFIFCCALVFVLRFLFVAFARYLGFGHMTAKEWKKKIKPKNIFDLFFFGYIVKTATHNSNVIRSLYFFNILNTLVLLALGGLILIGISYKNGELYIMIFVLIGFFELAYLRVLSESKLK